MSDPTRTLNDITDSIEALAPKVSAELLGSITINLALARILEEMIAIKKLLEQRLSQ